MDRAMERLCEHEYEAIDAGPYSDDIFYEVCKKCCQTKPEEATQPNRAMIDCPLCAPNPCIGGAHRNAMIEDGVIVPSGPVDSSNGITKIFGTWPGDETDEQLLGALSEIRKESPEMDLRERVRQAVEKLEHMRTRFSGSDWLAICEAISILKPVLEIKR